MEMEIKVGDKFILHSTDGNDYDIEVINVNLFREIQRYTDIMKF